MFLRQEEIHRGHHSRRLPVVMPLSLDQRGELEGLNHSTGLPICLAPVYEFEIETCVLVHTYCSCEYAAEYLGSNKLCSFHFAFKQTV